MAQYGFHPRQLRPHRLWYWIGGGLITLGVLGGGAGCTAGFVQAMSVPDFTTGFSEGEQVEVEIPDDYEQEEPWVLYTDRAGSQLTQQDCTVDGPDDAARVEHRGINHTVEVGSEYWERLGQIHATEPGTYTLTCDGGYGAQLGLGQDDEGSAAPLFIIGALASLMGLVGGATTLLVTGIRRSNHKKRLQQQVFPPGPYPGAGPYGAPPPGPGGPPGHPPNYS